MTSEKRNSSSNSMWGGRFAGGPAAIMRDINASIAVDKRLWREDIAASKAHAAMLVDQQILSEDDGKAISADALARNLQLSVASQISASSRNDSGVCPCSNASPDVVVTRIE